MTNMSYCRFRNTLPDLEDCREHLEDKDLSAEEAKAAERFVSICAEISADYEGYQASTHQEREDDSED